MRIMLNDAALWIPFLPNTVKKNIWAQVDENFRPLEEARNDCLELYVLFSYNCLIAYKKTQHLSFLNTLIKANDIISSQSPLPPIR
jgi:hypothetical protein